MGIILEILKSIVYGVIQGITEWLPISSTGHMILVNTWLPLRVFESTADNIAFWEMYKVVIQFGSILAVAVQYFRRLNPFNPNLKESGKRRIWRLWILIIIATIPAGIAGVLLDDLIDEHLSTPIVVAIALIVYGILFIVIENREKEIEVESVNGITPKKALSIGAFQMLALIPGTSRSGSTILGSTLLGLSRTAAAEFSFFMAMPVMLGASILKLFKLSAPITFGGILVLLVGMITAFIVSVYVIRIFVDYLRKNDFKLFGYYRIILGVIILILALVHLLPEGLTA